MVRRILYIQYTNPACYPSLVHSSHILARRGWKVRFMGIYSFGSSRRMRLEEEENITVKLLPYCPEGWLQKFHYLRFCVWTVAHLLSWRPQWVYVSDPLSCPLALFVSCIPGIKVIYHEHDSPSVGINTEVSLSGFMKVVFWARRRAGRWAQACIFPNEQRLKIFAQQIGESKTTLFCVWNCPSKEDVSPSKKPHPPEGFKLYYHGSLSQCYFPSRLLDALAMLSSKVTLKIVGYETVGTQGYTSDLQDRARQLGIIERIEIMKPPTSRHELLQLCCECDVGLVLVPRTSQDINHTHLRGASNKAFEYLACGLATLVSDLPGWREMYVEAGYSLACNPEDVQSIAGALRWFFEHPLKVRQMGEKGRQRILHEWNYEKQFSPILELLNRT
ncbi:MAG: glycosyltransferase [Candidatus Omnitrophota bacterium]|nr:MAG: glycosyltransferase [Candidatus Omnitrophota bacterium]